jgi:hypothetical protein
MKPYEKEFAEVKRNMTDSFTAFWSNERCTLIRKYHLEGQILDTLFGGPHTSEPSFKRAGVNAGDTIYPIRVYRGSVYIIASMRVREIISIEMYIERNPEMFADFVHSPWASVTFDEYIKLHPEKRTLAPTCTEEGVLGYEGTAIRLNLKVPPDLLERLRFRSQRRERGLKYVEAGRLTRAISIQGIYRLSEQSAEEIKNLVNQGDREV